jgi:hypothetical protein
MFLSILCAGLVFCILILRKILLNHNVKLQQEIDNLKIETKKEFERIRFTEKPICKVGDVYSKKFVVTKAKYVEYDSYKSCNVPPVFLLQITNEYELLNLETKETLHFRSNFFINKFIKDNNLKITKIGK